MRRRVTLSEPTTRQDTRIPETTQEVLVEIDLAVGPVSHTAAAVSDHAARVRPRRPQRVLSVPPRARRSHDPRPRTAARSFIGRRRGRCVRSLLNRMTIHRLLGRCDHGATAPAGCSPRKSVPKIARAFHKLIMPKRTHAQAYGPRPSGQANAPSSTPRAKCAPRRPAPRTTRTG